MLIGTIATTLLNFAPPGDTVGLVAATIFSFASLTSIAYSCKMFVQRALKLRRREATVTGVYYDKWGPTILCGILGSAVLVNLGLRIYEMQTE